MTTLDAQPRTDDARREPLPIPRLPARLDTPALVIDRPRLEANIARLQAEMDRRGITLRPHAKTHKSVRIGRLLQAGGARGLTVGTLGEAEVFAAGGITDLFLAYPLWASDDKAARLQALLARAPELRVGVDTVEGARRLAAAVEGRRTPLTVLVEVDPRNHRTGVASPADAVQVATAARDAGLEVVGVFCHGGHSYRPGAAGAAGLDEITVLEAAADALIAAGIPCPILSAGATPTMHTAAGGRITEMRAGTYVLGDRQQWHLGSIGADGCAASVAATVVSVHADRIVLDAGAKALTKDKADWLEGYGVMPAYPSLVIERVNDYHGIVRVPPGVARPAIGEIVAVVPNHVCPVVDLFDSFHVVAADGTSEIWPVDARGRSG
jgi:D-serine deaminase-like pyridoxal phosphate-dependent protein